MKALHLQGKASFIQRTSHSKDILCCHVGVYHSGLDTSMPKEFLNRPDIIAVFKKMRSKTVPQCMNGGLLSDSSGPAFLKNPVDSSSL